ncbi:proton-conducting transporter membrane subunit, partial [Streptosporangium algeriense]
IAASAADLLLTVVMWHGYPGGIGYEARARWIPALGAGYHVGVDGLSLPLIAMTALLFLSCAVCSARRATRARPYAALFLALQTVCTGLFAALDLLLFFVFFDLSIAGMYFVIAGWGHGDRHRSALRFFLYTFLGSLALLLGSIGVGGLVGAVLTAPVNRLLGVRWALFLDLVGTILMMVVPAVFPRAWAVGVAAFAGGMGGTLWTVNSRTLAQMIVPDRLLGRYSAASRLLSWGTLPIGAGLAGLLAELAGVRAAFAGFAVLAVLPIVPFLLTVTEGELSVARRESEIDHVIPG